MRALRKPKGHCRRPVVVLEGEEANTAVNKGPWVVHVVHQERVGSRAVSLEIPRTSFGPVQEDRGWSSTSFFSLLA